MNASRVTRIRLSRARLVAGLVGSFFLPGIVAAQSLAPPSAEWLKEAQDACRTLQQVDPQKATVLCGQLPQMSQGVTPQGANASAPDQKAIDSTPPAAPSAVSPTSMSKKELEPTHSPGRISHLERFFVANRLDPSGASPDENSRPGQAGTEDEPLRQFGYDVFHQMSAGSGQAIDAPVSADYVVGPGDEFTITLWGLVEGLYKVQIDRNGEVTLPRAGVISVGGLRFGELRPYLERHLAKFHTDFHLSVAMGRLRNIRVYVVGEVQHPGAYTLTPLSTALNAVWSAGGPTKRGSLRDVRVVRAGKTASSIDLYDFLLKGDRTQDIKLQHEDTVVVQLIGPTVAVSGNVTRPAIYELKGKATLADALDLAGGPRPTADLSRVQIERVMAHQKRVVVDLDLSGGKAPTAVPVHDLDVIKLFPIEGLARNTVWLSGHVARPGEYQFTPGMRVRDVIATYDQFLPEPSLDYSEIIRYEYPTQSRTVLTFSIEQMMAGNPRHNVALQDRDEIRVYPASRFRSARLVTITGAVRFPGQYRLFEDMTVLELIRQAGNPTEDAFVSRAEIRRKVPMEDETYERTILYFRLDRLLAGDESEKTSLQSDDEVVIYAKSDARSLPQVAVHGEVRRPGSYPLLKGMRVRDLLFEGGLTRESALHEAELVRVSNGLNGAIHRTVISLDPDLVLLDDPEQNLALEGGDELLIKQLGELKREYRVTIQGEVRFPGTYVMRPGERLSSLIQRAGGFTDKAYVPGAVFTRKSVRESQERQLQEFTASHTQRITAEAAAVAMSGMSKDEAEAARFELTTRQEALKMLASKTSLGRVVIQLAEPTELEGTAKDLLLEDGDHLVIPPPPSSVAILGSVRNPTAVMAVEGRSLDAYVALAGGYLPNADRKAVYVVRSDGSSVSLDQVQTVEAGDAILVPPQIEAKYRPLPLWRDVATIVGQFALAIAAVVVVF